MNAARQNLLSAVRPRFLALLIAVLCFAGCAHPEPTLVVVVGGLGMSQLGDLRQEVQRQCPHANVESAGAWDGYKADLKAIAAARPHEHIIFVGHSFGCQAIADAASQLPRIDLAVFIDPAWNDFPLPPTVARYLWYQRSDAGIEREALIVGAGAPRVIEGGHNDLPHSAELIASVVGAINSVQDSPSAPRHARNQPRASTEHKSTWADIPG